MSGLLGKRVVSTRVGAAGLSCREAVTLGLVLCVATAGNAVPPAHAGVDAATACAGAKGKAAGKQAADMLKAWGTYAKKPDPAKLVRSLSKAESKLTKAFTKAEGKGGCGTMDDVDDIKGGVDAFVADVNALIVGESASGPTTATTDTEDDGATPDDDVETTVTDPGGGSITIRETTTTVVPPPGFTLIGREVEVNISGPVPTAADPYVLIFRLDSTLSSAIILTALELLDVHVFQYNATFPNGRLVDPCTGDAATPDPCVRRSFDTVQNDVVLSVYTTTASRWAFGTPLGTPDDCCTALNPQTVDFTFAGAGTCGILRNFRCAGDTLAACATDADCPGTGPCAEVLGGNLPLDLACGALYLGGGSNFVPLPITLPGMTTSSTDVTSCDATSGVLTLGSRTAAETGSARTCTSGRGCSGNGTPCVVDSDCPVTETCDTQCFFGAPVPIPNTDSPGISVCAVLDVQTDTAGTATCNGDIDLDLPLRMNVFLNGDLLAGFPNPDVPGPQGCPICVRQCVGGTNADFPCDGNAECDSGNCTTQTSCMGGPNDGLSCTPGSLDLGDSYRTSHDCPSDPGNDITMLIGGVPLDLALTTGQVTTNGVDQPTQDRVFCGFCRDVFGNGSLCFEGEGGGCPAAIPAGAGFVTCTSDGDCSDADEYESCVQRNPGAFSEAQATQISLTGKLAPPSLGGDSRLVTTLCIPPADSASVNAVADWPGPGALMLLGEVSLSP
jgi:hypothetical protein